MALLARKILGYQYANAIIKLSMAEFMRKKMEHIQFDKLNDENQRMLSLRIINYAIKCKDDVNAIDELIYKIDRNHRFLLH